MTKQLIQDGVVHSGPARAKEKSKNDRLLIEDHDASKLLWKEAKGNVRGFEGAWGTKYDRELPLQEQAKEMDAPIDPKTGKYETHPPMLDATADKRVVKNMAYSLVRTKAGWCVTSYLINGRLHVYMGSTKPEHKQFALARISRMLQESVT